MIPNSVSNLSSSYLQTALGTAAGNYAAPPSAKGELSPFAQLMNSLSNSGSTGNPANTAAGTGNFGQSLNQLISSFQMNGVQNQGQTLDPSSLA